MFNELIESVRKQTAAVENKMEDIDKAVDIAIAKFHASAGNRVKTIWVSSSGDDGNDGSSESKAYRTFSKAFSQNREHALIINMPAGDTYTIDNSANYHNSIVLIRSVGDVKSKGNAKLIPRAYWLSPDENASTFEHGWRSTGLMPSYTSAVLIIYQIDTETFNPPINESQKHISGRSALFARADAAMNSVIIHYLAKATINYGSLFASGSGTTLNSGFKMSGVDYDIADVSEIATTGCRRYILCNEDSQPLSITVNGACSITDGHNLIDFFNVNDDYGNIICNSPRRLGIGAVQ